MDYLGELPPSFLAPPPGKMITENGSALYVIICIDFI